MSYLNLPRLAVTALNERVCQTLRDAVVGGALRPGERLVEDRIAEQLGVSRAPVREALLVLEREGLVRSLPRRGAIVAVLTRHDVGEIYGMRGALECQAARNACKKTTSAVLEELDALVRRMEQFGLGKNRNLLADEDIAFHRRIVELSGNGRLLESWLAIMSQVRMLQRYVIGSHDTDVGVIAARHRTIVDGLASGDPDQAERCVRDHLEATTHHVFESFPESTDEARGIQVVSAARLAMEGR